MPEMTSFTPGRSGPDGERLAQTTAATRIVLRPLANPLPLGFLGLFFATVAVSSIELGWLPADQTRVVAVGILLLTVPVQLIACIYGFLVRDLVAGTGMGLLAGTWGTIATVLIITPPGAASPGLGMLLTVAGVALVVPAAAATESKVLAASVNLTTAVRWWTTAVYELGAPHVWKTVAGSVGLALAALAVYAALAFELEDQRRQTVLPVLRRGSGEQAITGDLYEQVGKASNEAGIRKQL